MALPDDTRPRFFIFGGILLATGLAFDASQIVPNNGATPDEDVWRLVWVIVDLAITVVGAALFLIAYVSYLESKRTQKPAPKE